MAHRTPIKVRFCDLDPYGHVNHSVFLSYFEVGRADALKQSGMSLISALETGVQFVIARASVNYKAPVTTDHEVFVTSQVALKRISTMWSQQIVDANGQLFATAEIKTAVTDTSGKPVLLSEDLKQRLEWLTC